MQELISLFNKLEASLVANKLKQQLMPKVQWLLTMILTISTRRWQNQQLI